MNSRGQFWSLDVVLAAAIFTLAIGLVLSSSELSIFYGQQEKNTQQLFTTTFLNSNNLTSRTDLWVQYLPALCDPLQGGNVKNCIKDDDCNGQVCSAGAIDISHATINLRCGPTFDFEYIPPPPMVPGLGSIQRKIHGWLSDNELSALDNCIVDYNTSLRSILIGSPPDYLIHLDSNMIDHNNVHFSMSQTAVDPQFTIARKMIVFPYPFMPDANILRECLDGNCGEYLTDVNLKVWRG